MCVRLCTCVFVCMHLCAFAVCERTFFSGSEKTLFFLTGSNACVYVCAHVCAFEVCERTFLVSVRGGV